MILAFGLLAHETDLTTRQRALLVLAAFVHELDQAGRYATRRLFAQETALYAYYLWQHWKYTPILAASMAPESNCVNLS